MIYLLAVVAASYLLPRLVAVGTAIGAVAALNFFFVPPRYTLAVEHREHLIALAAMLAVALLVSWLSAALKRESRRRARASRAPASCAASPSISLAAGGEGEAIDDRPACAAAALRRSGPAGHLDRRRARRRRRRRRGRAARPALLHRRGGGARPRHRPLARARRLVRAARHARPRRRRGAHRARAGERRRSAASTRRRSPRWSRRASGACACSTASLAARAEVERQQRAGAPSSPRSRTTCARRWRRSSPRRRRCEAQREPARRRPSRAGCSPASSPRRATSPPSPRTPCSWCASSAGGGALRAEWQSLEEIVGSVVGRLRGAPVRRPHRRARSSRALPLVRGDATLLAQLLTNLLDNALQVQRRRRSS